MREIQLSWTELKALKTAKNLSFNFDENAGSTEIQVFLGDNDILWYAVLTDSGDITDFQDNYESTANKRTPHQVMIGDATTEVDIVNDGTHDRLAVDSLVSSINNVPANHFRFIIDNLRTTGGSKYMNVDGTTPVNFDYIVPAGVVFFVQVLSFIMQDVGTNSLAKFGGLTALTNGVKIEFHIGGVTYVVGTIKDNAELITTFNTGIGVENSLFSATLAGNITFDSPIRLVGDDGDYVRIIIQDDLDGIGFLESRFQGFEVL